MRMIQPYINEFKHEGVGTRRVLERVREKDFDFKPHAKSMNLLQLASHLATIPHWAVVTLQQDRFEFDPATYKPWIAKTPADLVSEFDALSAKALAAMESATDASLLENWSLVKSGATIFSMPRIVVLRNMVMNHSVHHRAQVTVYLRMCDVPVPSLYGPSADEK